MLQVNVNGGTRAGVRTVKAARRRDWTCPVCGKKLRYYWSSCPADKHPRPEE